MNKLMLFLVLVFSGCATIPNLNSVSLGMTKSEVIKILGNPQSVSARDNTEYLKYSCLGAFWFSTVQCNSFNHEYFVRLVNGKVESYGKVGDFDSQKDQTNVIKLETQE